jgi:hypothetical protein
MVILGRCHCLHGSNQIRDRLGKQGSPPQGQEQKHNQGHDGRSNLHVNEITYFCPEQPVSETNTSVPIGLPSKTIDRRTLI